MDSFRLGTPPGGPPDPGPPELIGPADGTPLDALDEGVMLAEEAEGGTPDDAEEDGTGPPRTMVEPDPKVYSRCLPFVIGCAYS